MLTDTAPDDFAAQVAAADAQEKAAYDAQQVSLASGLSGASIAYATLGAAIGAYHGVKRHGGSVGWGLLWALAGGAFPAITAGIAVAQGFSKEKK